VRASKGGSPTAKIKIGPPLNGIDGRKSGTFEGFNYFPANKSSGITWSEETFPKYIRAPMQEMPAPAWHLSASRTTRTSQISGPISRSPGLMGRRTETRRAGQEGKKQESRWVCNSNGSLT
jgi:hypothetical protein